MFRTDQSRRQSTRPIRKAAQNPSQSGTLLIFIPPNWPGYPRAIRQATCGPVHASTIAPVPPSTVPVAISPARPDHTCTVHCPCASVASVVGFGG